MFKRTARLSPIIPLFLVLVLSSCFWTNPSPRINIDATPSNNWVSPDDIYNDGDTYVVQHSY